MIALKNILHIRLKMLNVNTQTVLLLLLFIKYTTVVIFT